MKLKGKRLWAVYLPLIAAMSYSALQLSERTVAADEESGTCCTYSSDCAGASLCYLPDKRASCCNPATSGCGGSNYCQSAGLLD
jgi:hypothetical protein